MEKVYGGTGVKMESILRFLCLLAIAWFILPMFTGFVVNIGNVTGIAVFVLLYLCLTYHPYRNWPKAVNVVISVSAVCVLAVSCVLSVRMIQAINTQPHENSTLIVLGCEVKGSSPSLMLTRRLRKALAYLEENPGAKAVLSGGQGDGENISEAQAMFNWLTARGIDADRLYMEDRSTSTFENIQYSADLIRDNGLSEYAAAATNEFHVYRALYYAKKAGLKAGGVPAPTPWWLLPTFWVRELYGILDALLLH